MTDLAHRHLPLSEVDSDVGTGADRAGPTPGGLVRPVVSQPRHRSRRAGLTLRTLVPLIIFGLWWVLTGTGVVPPTKFPTPATTWDTFVTLLRHQDLIGNIGVSVARAAVGLVIGAGIGLLLGIVVGLSRLGEELLDSSLQMFRTIPFPAVIFLFLVWVGIGEVSKVLLIALATLFPMYLNTSNGVRNVDGKVVEAARSFGLRGRRLVRQVVIPLALPSILTGLRFSTGVSIIALVFAETLNASKGIGYLVLQASSFNDIGVLVVCIILYALLGIGADLLVRSVERASMPWRRQLAVR
jgi:sulfonate transport system permease protein